MLSTNGTLITEVTAKQLKAAGFSYVGVSLDGIGETNNQFQRQTRRFRLAVAGIRNCLKAGVRTGLRFTVTKYNVNDVPEFSSLLSREDSAGVFLPFSLCRERHNNRKRRPFP